MILFDRTIYLKEAVEQACVDYRVLAEIKLKETEKQFLCEIKNTQADPVLTADEFCNYVLNLTIIMSGAGN